MYRRRWRAAHHNSPLMNAGIHLHGKCLLLGRAACPPTAESIAAKWSRRLGDRERNSIRTAARHFPFRRGESAEFRVYAAACALPTALCMRISTPSEEFRLRERNEKLPMHTWKFLKRNKISIDNLRTLNFSFFHNHFKFLKN